MSTDKKSSWLRGLLFEPETETETETTTQTPKAEQVAQTQPTLVNSIPGTSLPPAPDATSLQADKDKFKEHLMKVMKDANLPGPDYCEFRDGVKALASMPLDDATKTIAVFTTLHSQGATKDVILGSANDYLNIIQTEKSQFLAELEKKAGSKITKLELQLKENNERCTKIDEEIQALIAEKGNLQATAVQLATDLQNSRVKAETNKVSFETAYNEFVNEVQSDITKITAHIK